MANEPERQLLLAKYGLADESELEEYYPGAKALLSDAQNQSDVLARLVRVVAGNKALVQRGLPSLCMVQSSSSSSSSRQQHHDADEDSGELTAEERRVLEASEGGGLVLGIPVGGRFYRRCMRKCQTKRVRALDANALKQFILRFLKGLAKEELRREKVMMMVTLGRSSSSSDHPHHVHCSDD
jgi:hypothetical protein